MKKIILLIVLYCCVANLLAQQLYIKGKDFEGVVFSEKHIFPFFIVKKRFTPTKQDIDSIEKKVGKDLDILLRNYKGWLPPICKIKSQIASYKRQYFGIYQNNEKIIFISFCLIKSEKWKNEVVITEGGGCSYFKLKYSLAKRTLYDLNINDME